MNQEDSNENDINSITIKNSNLTFQLGKSTNSSADKKPLISYQITQRQSTRRSLKPKASIVGQTPSLSHEHPLLHNLVTHSQSNTIEKLDQSTKPSSIADSPSSSTVPTSNLEPSHTFFTLNPPTLHQLLPTGAQLSVLVLASMSQPPTLVVTQK